MGLIGRVLGGAEATTALGDAATGVAEVFTPNATRRMELSAGMQRAATEALAEEFRAAPTGPFDRFVNALNRLPRPMLAFGTLGLFVFAMADPQAFAHRMAGLEAVPEPLWWLLGAIVSFYFGAREMHYFRAPEGRPGRRLGRAAAAAIRRAGALAPEGGSAPLGPDGPGGPRAPRAPTEPAPATSADADTGRPEPSAAALAANPALADWAAGMRAR